MELVQELQEAAPAVLAADAVAGAGVAAAELGPSAEPAQLGLMREWCSFAALYKDSYCSGPNRFEVMTALATERGLGITGLAIAGKPAKGPHRHRASPRSVLCTMRMEFLAPLFHNILACFIQAP
jgi:hypothetical protein